jgi:hypothetical protein
VSRYRQLMLCSESASHAICFVMQICIMKMFLQSGTGTTRRGTDNLDSYQSINNMGLWLQIGTADTLYSLSRTHRIGPAFANRKMSHWPPPPVVQLTNQPRKGNLIP